MAVAFIILTYGPLMSNEVIVGITYYIWEKAMSLTGAKGDGGGDRSGGVEGRGGHGKDGVGTM